MARVLYLAILLVASFLPAFGQRVPSFARFRPRDVLVVGTAPSAGLIPGLLGNLQARQSVCSVGYAACASGLVCCPVGGDCCSNNACCPTGYVCYSSGCCPRGRTCSDEVIGCVISTDVLCPGENFCCPPGQTCSRVGGIPRCDASLRPPSTTPRPPSTTPRPPTTTRPLSTTRPPSTTRPSTTRPPSTTPLTVTTTRSASTTRPTIMATRSPSTTRPTSTSTRTRSTTTSFAAPRPPTSSFSSTTTSEVAEGPTGEASNANTSTRSTNRTAVAIGSSIGGVILLAAVFTAYMLYRNKSSRTNVGLPEDAPLMSTGTSQYSVAGPGQWQTYTPPPPSVLPHSHTSFPPTAHYNVYGEPWSQYAQNTGPEMYQHMNPTPTNPSSFPYYSPIRPSAPEM